ncbi:MAG: chemotaxis protein CheA [Myxococcota bacterium]
MGNELGDKAREEFLSEAQEIIDRLSRDLLLLDATTRVGPPDPDLVNGVFRGVHTLKGLCGLFNATRLSALSHELENTLDDLRLGRTELTPELLDQLFRAVELYNRLLASNKDGPPGDEPDEEFETFLRELRRRGTPASVSASQAIAYDLDANMLAVLTEYEEHRLRTSIEQGMRLYRVRVAFQLATIDDQLEALKVQLKPFGEILTYLPTGGGADADSIELEILLASAQDVEVLSNALSSLEGVVEEMPRMSTTTGPPSTGAPPAPGPDSMVPSVQAPQAAALPARLTLAPHLRGAKPSKSTAEITPRRETSLRSVAQTVRVDIQRLDHLMNLLGELAIVRGGLERVVDQVRVEPALRQLARDLGRLHHGFDRHLAAMQTAILDVRMVPLGQVFEKLARVARQASREVHKEVNLVITGAETEVDKLIGEELSDPLMHMIRNALDHGIEDGATRERVGKPTAGTIALNAYQKGNQVVVEVEDDGSGIDPNRLVRVAVQSKALPEAEATELSEREKLALIFLPGISTRSEASRLSGRGVGMDVVRTNIGRLGGVVDVHSELGIGSKFTITLPITLAMISALMVRVGDQTYAVPLSSVQEALLIDSAEVRDIEGREVATVRGKSMPLCRLGQLFQSRPPTNTGSRLLVVVASAASRRCGFIVDDIVGRQDIVIKALTGPLRTASGFAGATELGDQRVALVLDMPSLLEQALSSVIAPRRARLHG